MRIDVKKFLFFGLATDKNAFFSAAQKLGKIHFIESQASNRKIDENIQLFVDAIRILRSQPPLDQETHELNGSLRSIAKKIVSDKQRLDQLDEDIRMTRLDIQRISIFGQFDLNDIEFIKTHGHLILQFFAAKKGVRERMADRAEIIYIDSDGILDYFVSFNKEMRTYEGMIEMKIDHSLEDLRLRMEKAKSERQEIELELQELAKYKTALHQALIHTENGVNLHSAEMNVESILNDQLFAATGWIPTNHVNDVYNIAKNLDVHIEELPFEASETIPTYLENHNLSRMGEDVINIYDTPSTTDKDPSLWVLFAFLLFFAIIVGDGGYGSIFLGLALYFRYKFPDLKGSKKRVLNLFTLLCVCVIGWGVLSSTFFGISLGPENPLRKLSLISYLAEKKADYHFNQHDKMYQGWLEKYPGLAEVSDPHEMIMKGIIENKGDISHDLLANLSDQILMELALFIGVIHIILGMIRYSKRNWSNWGWIIFLIGAYLYFPVFLGTPSLLNYVFNVPFERGGEIGLNLIAIGIPGAVVLSMIRNGFFLGLAEIMNLIQVFADVLSYLRLYALGLSGAILSNTINEMAFHLPLVLAIVLIVVGHLINMLLGIMGGVIHGLRLNFLEWYHYSFEGGGRKFKPLELKEVE